MMHAGFARIDLIGLQGLITDEDIDLVPLSYSKDEQIVSFDVLLVKRDQPRTEIERNCTRTVYPIVRRTVRFQNVTHFERRISRRAGVKLRGVTIYCGKEGRIEINGCAGKLVMTASDLRIEVGPESETQWELVHRTLWGKFGFATWRLKATTTEEEKKG